MIGKGLEDAGFELVESAIKSPWTLDEEALKGCFDLGKKTAKELL